VYSGHAYDAMKVLLDGLGKGVTSRRQMLDHVRDYQHSGVIGPTRFRADGNLDTDAGRFWVYKVVNGEAQVLAAVQRP
jgi:branched-chain amino acid transport system substrate-binding protein